MVFFPTEFEPDTTPTTTVSDIRFADFKCTGIILLANSSTRKINRRSLWKKRFKKKKTSASIYIYRLIGQMVPSNIGRCSITIDKTITNTIKSSEYVFDNPPGEFSLEYSCIGAHQGDKTAKILDTPSVCKSITSIWIFNSVEISHSEYRKTINDSIFLQ